jgi:hypothetical protein
MSEQFRAMMRQAHIDGERMRRQRVVEVFRGISRAQTYYKTANDLKWISMVQLADWLRVKLPFNPRGGFSYYDFANTYHATFVTLSSHGFLNWGQYKDGWDSWHHNGNDPEWVLFQLTENGSQFLKQCDTDADILRYMGLHK